MPRANQLLHPARTPAALPRTTQDRVLHHSAPLQRQLWANAKAYFAERTALGAKVLSKLKLVS